MRPPTCDDRVIVSREHFTQGTFIPLKGGTEMAKIIQLYLLTTVVFFAIDIAWLSVVANRFYQSQIGSML